jgi:hypothetical protein
MSGFSGTARLSRDTIPHRAQLHWLPDREGVNVWVNLHSCRF